MVTEYRMYGNHTQDEIVEYALGIIPEYPLPINWHEVLFHIEEVFDIDLPVHWADPRLMELRRAIYRARSGAAE